MYLVYCLIKPYFDIISFTREETPYPEKKNTSQQNPKWQYSFFQETSIKRPAKFE